MKSLTARPEKIIGNIALASLLAGPPIGVALSLLGGLLQPSGLSVLDWIEVIVSGLFAGPFILFIAGLVVLAPTLGVLRHFGYGGPTFVYAITTLFSFFSMSSDLRLGLVSLAFSLPASYVFCKYSY
ncbi:hypothetical protein [Hahella sp. CCB-MM4]|uniref:hypothetical protein n=1 Tax=Hahella sp. (strain CCB-MM4) TaxID=1926491 RepID=UPI000B9B0981|nr:hypothetical protein [Hahella sp. CCB-MM4]